MQINRMILANIAQWFSVNAYTCVQLRMALNIRITCIPQPMLSRGVQRILNKQLNKELNKSGTYIYIKLVDKMNTKIITI